MATKNGFMVMSWMVKKYGLNGNDLVGYAYLYAETNQGKEAYTGGYRGLSEGIGVTAPTAYNVLSKLKKNNLIEYNDTNSVRVVVDAKK